MSGNRRRYDIEAGRETDWVDAPEDFEPLLPETLRARAPMQKEPSGDRDLESEADWVDPPEAFGAFPVEDDGPLADEPDAETIVTTDHAPSDRNDGPADIDAIPIPVEETTSPRPETGARKTRLTDKGKIADSAGAQNELHTRFAEAFLAELDSTRASRIEGIQPERAHDPEPSGAGNADFEEELRQVFRRAARGE